MPELKDKYSDSQLDPAQQDFEDIINRPDMRALNDQGDAIARDLQGAERASPKPSSPPDASKVPAAESQRGADSKNRFKYQKPDTDKGASSSNGMSNRRKWTIGGGVGGIGGLLIVAAMLLPLKVPGILQLITDTVGKRIEQITERRAKVIIGRAILTKFGTNTGVVITGNGAFRTLVTSMRTSGFEKRLAAKGLTITSAKDGVKLQYKGKPLGNGNVFKNEKAIMDALDSNRLTNAMVKDIVKEEIPSWRWVKRAKFAKWLRYKYGIPRFGLTNSKAETEEERTKELDTQRAQAASQRMTVNFRSLLSCIMIGSCDQVDGSGEPSNKAGNEADAVDDFENTATETTAAVKKDGLRKSAAKTLSKELLSKFGSKTIPIIGWIDVIATIDNLVYSVGNDDYLGKVASGFKAAQYAGVYADWAGYGSQIQLGAMDPEYVGVLADELNGAETSQAMQAIEGNPGVGTPPVTTVDNDRQSSIKKVFAKFINSGAGAQYKNIGHPVLKAYYETVGGGGFLGWISGKAGGLIGSLSGAISGLVPGNVKEKVTEAAQNALKDIGPLVLKTFGLSIDPLATGPELMNNIAGGGVVSTNQYCQEIGCRKLSTEQAYKSDQTIAAEKASFRKQKGVWYALFSPQENTSLTSRMAVRFPSSTESAASMLAGTIRSVPQSVASLITGRTLAASDTSLESVFNVQPYGATEDDLNQSLSNEFLNGNNCPEVPEGDYNTCQVDTEIAKAMQCEFKPDSEECSDTITAAPSVCAVNEPAITKITAPTGGAVTGTIDMAVANIREVSGVKPSLDTLTKSSPDFITLNEVGDTSLSDLEKAAPGYGAYREAKPDPGPGGSQSLNNVVMWRKDKWTLLQGGQEKVTEDDMGYYNGKPFVWDRYATWGIFKRSDGAIVPVVSVHMMTNPEKFPKQHGNPKLTRVQQYKQSMEKLIQLTSTLAEYGPVLVGGDMNTQDNQGSWSAVPMMKTAGFNYINDGAVIYLFYPEGTKIINQRTPNIASDHPAVTAKIDMNGVGPSESSGGTSGGTAACSGSGGSVLGDTRVATYNIKVSGLTGPGSGWAPSEVRIKLAAGIVKSNDFDIIGFQEIDAVNFNNLKANLPEYSLYPKTPKDGPSGVSLTPISWKSGEFSLVKSGTYDLAGPFCPGLEFCQKGPWVRLSKTGGGELYVISVHLPNENRYRGPNSSDPGGAQKREATAKAIMKTIAGFEKGIPVFLVGDMNSSWTTKNVVDDRFLNGDRSRLPYCIFTADKTLVNAIDAVQNKTGCPTTDRKYEIDHIYLSTDLKVKKVEQIKNADTNKVSDHDPIYVDIEGNESAAAGGWSWPVDEKWWKTNRADFLSAHPTYSGTFTSPYVKGVAVDIGDPPDGSPVYAMLGGKVVKTNLCGVGDGMIIESNTPQGKLQIAYGHGTNPRFKVGDTVTSGKQILNLGTIGCKISGGVVHIDMALGGKHICPQDVFLAMDKGRSPDLLNLSEKARAPCGRL